MATKIEIIMEQERETKGTWRYKALDDMAYVGTIYVSKYAFPAGTSAPKRIKVTVTSDE